MPLLGGSPLLMNRNLLYTGITRARKCVTILGKPDVLNAMIHNTTEEERYTSLAIRIKEIFAS